MYVAPSTIVGAGGGLFAARPIRKGECLGRYEGRRVSAKEAFHPNFVRGYLMASGSGFLDGRDPDGRLRMADGRLLNVHGWTDATWRTQFGRPRGCRPQGPPSARGVEWKGVANLMRFVNAGDAAHPCNCVLTRTCGGVGYKTKRDVAAGEELLANYGGSYWKSQNDDTCAKCILPGLLVECDGCTRSYHLRCAGIASKKALPKGEWLCPHCRFSARR